MPKIINDGLTKHQRYRLKDLASYRKRKREYAQTAEQKKIRREYMRLWREKNRDKHNKTARLSHKRNRHKHVEKLRYKRFEKLYGITKENYYEMYQKQNGACLICSVKPTTERLFHIDHNHKTGGIRGLLCSRCNGHLGWFEKYEREIIQYLRN